MTDEKPVVYIFHGEDDYQMGREVSALESRMGDPMIAAMNITRLDGNSFQMDQLFSVAGAMPFLAPRRLIILTNPLARLKDKPAQENFLRQLEQIPPTTALVLLEHQPLTSYQDKKRGKLNFLERWAVENKSITYIKEFQLPKGAEWRKRIQEMAKAAGGQFSPGAADLLFDLLDGDVRLASQEVEKLLAYVNYRRAIEADDVAALTADVREGDIFALVDAVCARDGQKALGMLRRLMEYQDYYLIFGMIVRQFRLLVQTREILDEGGGRAEVGQIAGKNMRIAERLIAQSRHFTMEELFKVYCQLLNLDEAVKTSQMPDDLALETLVVSLTQRIDD